MSIPNKQITTEFTEHIHALTRANPFNVNDTAVFRVMPLAWQPL